MTSSSSPSASCTTASPLPERRSDVKTSSRVKRWRPNSGALLVEVEVPWRALLEPEPVVLRGLLQEVRRLLQQVLALLVGRHVIAGRDGDDLRVGRLGGRELARVVRRVLLLLEP